MYIKGETYLKIGEDVVVEGEEHSANFKGEYREFAAAIRENREPVASGRDVRKVIEVLEAARRSIREKQAVNL